MFNKFDKDGNGFIDAGELQQVSAELGKPLSEAEVAEVLATMDTNQDGKISIDELRMYFRRHRSRSGFAKTLAGLTAKISQRAK